MKYLQYKGVVEREYNMSLKKIMQQLCVSENLNASEAAKKLGIAREIFTYWRRYFRLENRQLLFDQTVAGLTELQDRYAEAAERKYKKPAAVQQSVNTIEELEDVVDNLIGYHKHIHYSSEGLALQTAKLPLFEFSKTLILDYKNASWQKHFKSNTDELEI